MREISVRQSRNVSIKEIWLVIYDLEGQKLVYSFQERTGSKTINEGQIAPRGKSFVNVR
jgi:hypothetical protein